MDLGFPIRHLQDKLNEFRLDLHRLRSYRSESWNYNVEHRVKEYEQAIAILTKANGVEQSESTCNLQNVSVSLPSDEEIETLADDMIFVSEDDLRPIEIYREGFIDGMTQLRDKLSGNER